MPILQGNQRRLEHAQQKERSRWREEPPKQDVHPCGRADPELKQQRPARHENAQQEDGKHGWAVAGVGKGIAEATMLAAIPEYETLAEQGALPAARAAQFEPGDQWSPAFFLHDGLRHAQAAMAARLARAPRAPLPMRQRRSGTPYVDAHEQKQPYHVDKVPVPGGRLEAEVLLGREVAGKRAQQADAEKQRANNYVRPVKAGRHEECCPVHMARVLEPGMAILIGL